MGEQGPGSPQRRWHGVHKALADPLRIRLVEALWEEPQSARELADRTGLPADRLYYHLGRLEAAGLVGIAEYRPLAHGKVERVYAPAVTEPPGDAATPEEMADFLGSMLDATRADINAAYRSREAGGRREVDLLRGALRLTDEALAELREHIAGLADRFGDRDAPGSWTRVVVALVDLQDRPPSPDAPATDPPPPGPQTAPAAEDLPGRPS